MDIDVKMEEKKPSCMNPSFLFLFCLFFWGEGWWRGCSLQQGCCLLHSKDKQKLKIQDFQYILKPVLNIQLNIVESMLFKLKKKIKK